MQNQQANLVTCQSETMENRQIILRPKQVADMFGVSLSTLYYWNNPKHRLYVANFPKSFKVGANATGWLKSEIDDYISQLTSGR